VMGEDVLVTVWLGQVVGNDEGAHGGISPGCGFTGGDAKLAPDCAAFAAGT
jgi:hypothetical protein